MVTMVMVAVMVVLAADGGDIDGDGCDNDDRSSEC